MTTKRRLLFYTHGLVGGGAERVWAVVASGLAARGHEVTFAVDFDASANKPFLDGRVSYQILDPGHGRAVLSLARLIRRVAPDVGLAAVGASNAKLLAARLVSGRSFGVVTSAHGRLDAEYGLLGRATYMASAITSRLGDRFVTASADLRAYLVERFFVSRARTLAIQNAVPMPPAEVVPDATTLAARPNVVVALGRLVPEKGIHTLIEAIALSRRAERLIVLGEGPERERLERLIGERGLAGRVELAGYVPEPWPTLANAKMLALASTTEAFGNVVVEAMAHGLPVVATRCGGPVEILENGRHGRLVPIGDVPALASAIDETLADPGDPAAHRARAECFALPVALDKFEGMIEAIVSERGR